MLSSLKHVHTLKCVVRKNQSNDNFTIRLFQYLFMFHDPTYLPIKKQKLKFLFNGQQRSYVS